MLQNEGKVPREQNSRKTNWHGSFSFLFLDGSRLFCSFDSRLSEQSGRIQGWKKRTTQSK